MTRNESASRTSSIETSSTAAESEDFAAAVDAIRADIKQLSATLTRFANKQVGYAQDRAIETAREAEATIRRNPLSAVAIAAGLGFVFGLFNRR